MDITSLLNSYMPWWHDAVPWVLVIGYALALILFRSVRRVSLIVIGAVVLLQGLFDLFSIGGHGGGFDDD